MIPFGEGKSLMKGFFTTFKPPKETSIIYNLETGEIDVPSHQTEKIIKGSARLYLHFLYFKKTKYWGENTNYGKSGFYKIADNYDFSKGGIVEITPNYIRLKNDIQYRLHSRRGVCTAYCRDAYFTLRPQSGQAISGVLDDIHNVFRNKEEVGRSGDGTW